MHPAAHSTHTGTAPLVGGLSAGRRPPFGLEELEELLQIQERQIVIGDDILW
jgi:hypothetical protein